MKNESVLKGALSRETESVLRNCWVRPGDKIQFFGQSKWEDAIVIGFGKKYINRGGIDHKYAGEYIDFQNVHFVPTAKGSRARFSGGVVPIKGSEEIMRTGTLSRIFIKIGELPDTPFWESDIVALKNTPFIHHYLVSGNQHFSPNPQYVRVENPITQENEQFPLDQVILRARGDIWKFEHNEQIDFANIEEEEGFHKSLGMAQRLIPEGNESRLWSRKEAWDMLATGLADKLILIGVYAPDPRFIAIKYDDANLGRRVRAEFFKQLGRHDSGTEEDFCVETTLGYIPGINAQKETWVDNKE